MTTATKDEYRDFATPMPTATCGDPVGALEIAGRLGLHDRSIHMIRRRGQLPRPDYGEVNGSRAWEWATILWWAGETARLRTAELGQAYREMFGLEPPEVAPRVAPVLSTARVDPTPAKPKVPSKAKANGKTKGKVTKAMKRPRAKAGAR